MNVHSASTKKDIALFPFGHLGSEGRGRGIRRKSATNSLPDALFGLRDGRLVEGEDAVASALKDAAEPAPNDREEKRRGKVLEDLLRAAVREKPVGNREEIALHLPAGVVEIRRVVMELEELDGLRVVHREATDATPELVEDRPRWRGHVELAKHGVRELGFVVLVEEIDERLFALEVAIDRPCADLRARGDVRDRRPVEASLCEE